jgi:hypothetical protein
MRFRILIQLIIWYRSASGSSLPRGCGSGSYLSICVRIPCGSWIRIDNTRFYNKNIISGSRYNLQILRISWTTGSEQGAFWGFFYVLYHLSPLRFHYVSGDVGIKPRVGNLIPAMGVGIQVGIGLSYRPASLCSLATQFQTRFLESIPYPIAGLKGIFQSFELGGETILIRSAVKH